MLISQTSRLNMANTTWGFMPIDVDTSSPESLLAVLRCDWSPFIFEKSSRAGENFRAAHCLVADIDNTDGERCTIDEFKARFQGVRYIISTSRSHGKEKKYGPGKTLVSAPCDRFHVLFPLDAPIIDKNELGDTLKGLISIYPFFDSAVSGAAQLIFGNPATEIHISEGQQIALKKIERKTIATLAPREYEPPRELSEEDFLSTPANRVRLMSALRNSAAAGLFESYSDWIRAGMALKAAGFKAEDFASISDAEAVDVALAKWDTFDPSQVTAGTLLYFAKQSTHLSFETEEDRASIELGEEILNAWKKNEQEERTKLLALRVKDASAGPAPANMMPAQGLIRDIAQYILRTSIRPIPELAIAAATAFVGVLAGRKFETSTGLGTNIYFVGLAESGSGKEHARRVIKNIAAAANVNHHIGGESLGSGPGLRASLEVEPSRIFLLDEFGLTLQALNSKNAASYQREIITTLMKLYSSYGSIYYGTEYADQRMRKRIDIDSPCCVLYATSTHGEFYAALSGGDGASGNIARMLIINAPEARPKRQVPAPREIPQDIIDRVSALANFNAPGPGNLSGFFPVTVFSKPEVEQAFIDLDESMTEKMTNDAARSVYARVAENAAKLALTYAVSLNAEAPIIDEAAFAWGRNLALWCANTLMEQFNSFVADTEHGKTIKKILLVIKSCGPKGMGPRELLRRVQEIRQQERDEIMKKLIDSGQVFERVDDEKKHFFVHANFYIAE